jgi:hypothetical protein
MSRLVALSLLVYTACASSEASTTPPSKPEPASSTGEAQKVCVDSFTHSRTCTDLYIPSLVDTRAKLDIPAGIAAEVKQDRDGVIAKAKVEWATDSTDENIAAHCQQMTAHMPDDAQAHALADAVRACEAQTECAAYVACMEPVQEQLIAHGPAHH